MNKNTLYVLCLLCLPKLVSAEMMMLDDSELQEQTGASGAMIEITAKFEDFLEFRNFIKHANTENNFGFVLENVNGQIKIGQLQTTDIINAGSAEHVGSRGLGLYGTCLDLACNTQSAVKLTFGDYNSTTGTFNPNTYTNLHFNNFKVDGITLTKNFNTPTDIANQAATTNINPLLGLRIHGNLKMYGSMTIFSKSNIN